MASKKKGDRAGKEDKKNKKIGLAFRILLPLLLILAILLVIFNSNITGNALYSKCIDSDNTTLASKGVVAINDASLFKKGSVSYGYSTAIDNCESGWVVEFFCENGYRNSQKVYCGENMCANGACISGCVDSDNTKYPIVSSVEDDESYFVKGNVTQGSTTVLDRCEDINIIAEYYCEKGVIRNAKFFGCPTDCKDGACVR